MALKLYMHFIDEHILKFAVCSVDLMHTKFISMNSSLYSILLHVVAERNISIVTVKKLNKIKSRRCCGILFLSVVKEYT